MVQLLPSLILSVDIHTVITPNVCQYTFQLVRTERELPNSWLGETLQLDIDFLFCSTWRQAAIWRPVTSLCSPASSPHVLSHTIGSVKGKDLLLSSNRNMINNGLLSTESFRFLLLWSCYHKFSVKHFYSCQRFILKIWYSPVKQLINSFLLK